jgi:hypothetical protein
MTARTVLARLMLVAGTGFCLWFLLPATAQATECGGTSYRAPGAPSPSPNPKLNLSSIEPPKTCNEIAGNGAKAFVGGGAAIAGGTLWWIYRNGRWYPMPAGQGGTVAGVRRTPEEITEEGRETTLEKNVQKGLSQDPNALQDVRNLAFQVQPEPVPLGSTNVPLAYSPDAALAIIVSVTAKWGARGLDWLERFFRSRA